MRQIDLHPANDDAFPKDGTTDLVSAHLSARVRDRRVMITVAAAAVAMLSLTLVNGFYALQTPPDLVTFAFRV